MKYRITIEKIHSESEYNDYKKKAEEVERHDEIYSQTLDHEISLIAVIMAFNGFQTFREFTEEENTK